jgi:sugar phosphate isomerase/epimerase
VPEGFDAQRAEDQFVHALRWCADALAGIGGTLVIEPLNRKESNQCNDVADGARLARASGKANVGSLADFYHVDEERESFEVLREVGAALVHVHLADTGRLNPGSGAYDYGGIDARQRGIPAPRLATRRLMRRRALSGLPSAPTGTIRPCRRAGAA